MRLINADALKDYYGKWSNNHTEFLKPEIDRYIDAQPTIDPANLRPKGEWVVLGDADYQCSQCGFRFTSGDPITKFPYCRCGADMRGAT